MHRLFPFATPLLLAMTLPAQAADLRVTTFLDEYNGQCTRQHCSLRDAVTAANDLGVARIILQAGEYRLSRENPRDDENEIIEEDENLIGDLDVTGELTVIGQGIQATTINGGQVDRVFEAHPQARLVLRNLGITGGRTPREGGGLYNQGYAELIGVRIYNNYAASMFIRGQGGGIFNAGSLLVRSRSEILDNKAFGSEGALGSGGGIYNSATGVLYVRDSRIGASICQDDNDSGEGCGIYNAGQADIARTLIDNNRNSVLGSGSAIYNRGQLRLVNSTLSGNGPEESYSTRPAALQNGGGWGDDNSLISAELVHVTIAGNHHAGITNAARLSIRNSVIAGNVLEYGEVVANCHNLASASYQARGLLLGIDGGNCGADQYINDALTFTHHLFPLDDNNGTRVHALRRTSAAIDTGVGGCSSHDQRGLDRPRDGNGDGIAICDLGAFERAYP